MEYGTTDVLTLTLRWWPNMAGVTAEKRRATVGKLASVDPYGLYTGVVGRGPRTCFRRSAEDATLTEVGGQLVSESHDAGLCLVPVARADPSEEGIIRHGDWDYN